MAHAFKEFHTQNEIPKEAPLAKRQVVLITGASTGLGLALAKKLIGDENMFLVFTARESSQIRFSKEKIISASNLWIRTLDITNPQQMFRLVEEINVKLGGVDILINNAGITDRCTVEESCTNYRQRQLDVNYLGPLDLITCVLSKMRKKRHGKIINVSSAGGFMAMPTMSSYSASKFALEAASEALWFEIRPFNIHVSLVIPGFINSEGFSRTIESQKCRSSLADITSTYHEHYDSMKKMIKVFMGFSPGTNDRIADKIINVIYQQDPPLRVFVTVDAWFFYLLRKILPHDWYLKLVYRFLPNIKSWGRQDYKE